MSNNYIVCQHYLMHKAERHECDGCCSQYVLIDDKINTINTVHYQYGVEDERRRILGLIKPHLKVCNYKAVNEEECDVCHWVEDTIDQILELKIVDE
jgi:hypothetical protein